MKSNSVVACWMLIVLIGTIAWAQESRRIRVGVMELSPSGVEKSLADNLTAVVVAELDRLKLLDVLSHRDIRNMLIHEQRKLTAGCTDASCLADIGGALGVEYLVAGSVDRVGDRYAVNLQLIDIRTARVEGRTREESGTEGELLLKAATSARRLAEPLLGREPGVLLVRVGEEGANVFVDDSLRGVSPLGALELAAGPHRVRVTKKGFVDWAREVEIAPKHSETLTITLIPSREFIEEYESRNSTLRTWAWISTGAAAVLGGAALGLFLYADQSYFPNEIEPYRNECIALGTACSQELRDKVESNGTTYDRMIYAVYFLGAAFALASGAALYCWLAGVDPARYRDFGSSARLEVLPAEDGGLVILTWTF